MLNRYGRPLLAALVLGMGALTLVPVSGGSTQAAPLSFQIVGLRGVADALFNLLLFVPFGVLISHQVRIAAKVAAWTFLLSLIIELIQLGVPGRYASANDLLFNLIGGLTGHALLILFRRWRRHDG